MKKIIYSVLALALFGVVYPVQAQQIANSNKVIEFYDLGFDDLSDGTNLILNTATGKQLYYEVDVARDGSKRVTSHYVILSNGNRVDLVPMRSFFNLDRFDNVECWASTDRNLPIRECRLKSSSNTAGAKGGNKKIAFTLTDGVPY